METRKLLIVGAGAIAMFAGACVLGIWIATDPGRGAPRGSDTRVARAGDVSLDAEDASPPTSFAPAAPLSSDDTPPSPGDAARAPAPGARPGGHRAPIRGERNGRSSEDD
ncbi:hypothetical protein [Anaeromyxobacter oryzisoli]|uniref:hypothetical protein n=1 Tax=Anaeromyxobacter oryzisoli TaxID=2925408 RepID=UPI001F5AF420|nr:hypothetical protein [Anaeromyxobacter sp. SG63]